MIEIITNNQKELFRDLACAIVNFYRGQHSELKNAERSLPFSTKDILLDSEVFNSLDKFVQDIYEHGIAIGYNDKLNENARAYTSGYKDGFKDGLNFNKVK